MISYCVIIALGFVCLNINLVGDMLYKLNAARTNVRFMDWGYWVKNACVCAIVELKIDGWFR